MIPPLDARLHTVLTFIRAEVHADIGSDHAHLPIHAVQTGRAARCVAVELNPGPFAHARENVVRAGLTAQISVRRGDGLSPLAPGEVQSASITGMGARTILGILKRAGEKVTPHLILQPNDSPRPLREWARAHGYHLEAEALAPGFWAYPVLSLRRREGDDPAYAGLPEAAALRYGPHLLREGSALLRGQVAADLARLTPLAAPGRPAAQELTEAQATWALLESRK